MTTGASVVARPQRPSLAGGLDELHGLIKRTVRAIEPDAEVILYGSRARGDAEADSDWDLLILVDGPVSGLGVECEPVMLATGARCHGPRIDRISQQLDPCLTARPGHRPRRCFRAALGCVASTSRCRPSLVSPTGCRRPPSGSEGTWTGKESTSVAGWGWSLSSTPPKWSIQCRRATPDGRADLKAATTTGPRASSVFPAARRGTPGDLAHSWRGDISHDSGPGAQRSPPLSGAEHPRRGRPGIRPGGWHLKPEDRPCRSSTAATGTWHPTLRGTPTSKTSTY